MAESEIKLIPENRVYAKPRLLTDAVMHFCPGCSHGTIHKLVAEVIDEMQVEHDAIGITPVGCAVLAGLPLAECVLYTSGRVPLDMVRKAIRAGVPVLVSKSMPTVQSAELAAEYGLQLVCGRKIPKV